MIDRTPGDMFRKGQVLNNTYEIERVLGSGGTGEVYRASNQITGRVVAIKVIKREFSGNAEYLELMKREEEMRAISHDAVVRYTDCSRTDDGHVYLVMDYVDGTPLSDWLERGGAAPRDLLIVAHRVAEGLVATHARKIVHRDLSPDNIILRNGRPEEAVIIDFGIAKDANVGARTIVGNEFAGKYEYAAPEQLHGGAEPRSDLYALGASLLATFRGRVPDFGGSPGELVRRKEKPLDTSGVPEPLKTLIDGLTQPDPARRPPSAAAVAADIERILKPSSARAVAPSGGTRRTGSAGAAAAIVAVLAAGAGVAAWYAGVLDGLIAPALPVASPYRIEAALAPDGTLAVEGNAPDAAMRDAILGRLADTAGVRPPAETITLASGAPSDRWADDVGALLGPAADLSDWRLAIEDRKASLTGTAPDAAARQTASEAFLAAASAAGYAATARLAAGPRSLSVVEVRALVRPLETCGPLEVRGGGGDTVPLGGTLTVAGSVAAQADLARIRQSLAPAVGDRTVRVEAEVLNEQLCIVRGLLPETPPSPVSIVFGNGSTGEPNMTGVYRVGDNPTIDILIPEASGDGHLWVAIADVTGNLFNILPNIGRPESAVAALGTVADGMRTIRVAYTVAEQAEDPERISFSVDETFGKTVVIVFRSDRPLFGGLRPTTESIKSFAKDFEVVVREKQVAIKSITTRLIDSRQ